jgi:hypothetical protein
MGITTDVVTVLHPAAEDVAEPQRLAPRLSSLQGTTVGLIDNHKRNANIYLEALGHLLQDRYGVSHVVTYRKVSQSMPTPDAVLDQLASKCDAVIHAVADWGSCTAWGLHDGIEAEKRGRAAVTVITQAFTQAARIRAEALGLPEHPVVVVEHPLASKNREQAQQLAQSSVEAVVRGLVAHQEETPHG